MDIEVIVKNKITGMEDTMTIHDCDSLDEAVEAVDGDYEFIGFMDGTIDLMDGEPDFEGWYCNGCGALTPADCPCNDDQFDPYASAFDYMNDDYID